MALLEEGIPSARLGKKLVDTILDAGFKNMSDFEHVTYEFLRKLLL